MDTIEILSTLFSVAKDATCFPEVRIAAINALAAIATQTEVKIPPVTREAAPSLDFLKQESTSQVIPFDLSKAGGVQPPPPEEVIEVPLLGGVPWLPPKEPPTADELIQGSP